jgi:DNA polymerase (family X)
LTNKEFIEIFDEIAELLELKNEDHFKIRAYHELSQFLSGYGRELSDIYAKGGKKALLEVEHIGEGIGKKVVELLTTGKLVYLEELKKSLPEGLENFLKIPGMGPKTAITIADKFKIKTIIELENILREGRVKDLKGFGKKTEEKLLKGIDIYKKGLERKMLGEAYPVALEIMEKLKKIKGVRSLDAAGSMRRMEETVGDIDILAVSTQPQILMEKFCQMENVSDVLSKGEKKSSVFTKQGLQVDLRAIDEKSYGAAMQYFTGNREHNVMLREIAVKKGYKLNEYGLFTINGDKLIANLTEEDIYNKLGLELIPPELRTGDKEIEAAMNNTLPKLITQKELKGDLHCHTLHTDGVNTVEEMAKSAIKRGYSYLAITNHSQSLTVARGLKPEAVLELKKEILKINDKYGGSFKLLMGTEVDILTDGTLDYPDEILRKMDIVVGSVHSHFNMDRQSMTGRIMKAMENKYLHIIGHISGRLINHREAYDLDYDLLIKKAAMTGTVLEINSQPDRLDIRDIYVKEAVKAGVKLAISTDAHSASQLDLMFYGTGVARRGWAQAKDIVNSKTLVELQKWMNLKRGK